MEDICVMILHYIFKQMHWLFDILFIYHIFILPTCIHRRLTTEHLNKYNKTD